MGPRQNTKLNTEWFFVQPTCTNRRSVLLVFSGLMSALWPLIWANSGDNVVHLHGAGASFPEAVYREWMSSYKVCYDMSYITYEFE